jgi:hypothetical protein
MKLDIDLIKSIIQDMHEFTNIEKQLFSVAGFDDAVSVAENVRITEFPCVLIEDVPDGNISFTSGFCDNRTVSVWVLKQAKNNTSAERRAALMESFVMSKKIMSRLIAANANRTDEDAYIDFARGTVYMARGPFAGNVYGYEFVYSVKYEIDLQ